MTSSTPELPWLEVRAGGISEHATGSARGAPPVEVRGAGALLVRAGGLEPGEGATLLVGEEPLEVVADRAGRLEWSDDRGLDALAGSVEVALEPSRSGGRLAVELAVRPTKLVAESVRKLLADLDAIAPGLASELGGRSRLLSAAEGPEAVLDVLESIVGEIEEAAPWIRRRPLGLAREDVRAAPAAAPRLTARDVRWLGLHPLSASRARASGREAAVRRRRSQDPDVPENRGAVGLFARLGLLFDEVALRLDGEADRLEEARAARRAFLTVEGTLWDDEDAPRLAAVARRRERANALRDDLARARTRSGLPAGLRAEPFRRSLAVETHPGYWGLYRAWQRIRELEVGPPPPRFSPVKNLDRLYETWTAVQLALALAEVLGRPGDGWVRLERDRWFVRLPEGELARAPLGASRELRLLREPPYSAGGQDPIVKLHPGRPWVPDLALEIRVAGWPVALHLFDAKHRLDRDAPDRIPWAALQEIWFKYTESIGFRESRLPAVASAWILFPGPSGSVRTLGPRMLEPDWPEERVRGGAIALTPGSPEGRRPLVRVLQGLLGPYLR